MVPENVTRAVKRAIGDLSLYPCVILDAIPAYERAHADLDDGSYVPGRWYRHGDWGCRYGLSHLWAVWGTGAPERGSKLPGMTHEHSQERAD